MSAILETDPRKGFVAFPMSVFDLDLTPGAFRTLAELCRMANTDGICWPSLRQLGERLGRSRAAISGYIAELRDFGLIETETQKMANGYNYRLRYRVVFWKEWRAQLGQRSERSVKSTERPLKTKNQIHVNQSPAPAVNSDLIVEWKKCVGRAPYPAFDTWPSEGLLGQTQNLRSVTEDISVDIIPRYRAFLSNAGVKPVVDRAVEHVFVDANLSDEGASAFLSKLAQEWKPHWRKPPSPVQLKRMLASVQPEGSAATRSKLLKSFLKRWEIYAESLSLAGRSSKVAA